MLIRMNKMMKAIVWTKYGLPDVLQLQDVEKPTPKDNEVLIKIHASTVTAGDCEVRSLKISPWIRIPMRIYVGFLKPKRITILGQELAGEIESVGQDVKLYKPGDRVLAAPGLHFGGYAEYVCLPEKGVMTIMSANMTLPNSPIQNATSSKSWPRPAKNTDLNWDSIIPTG